VQASRREKDAKKAELIALKKQEAELSAKIINCKLRSAQVTR